MKCVNCGAKLAPDTLICPFCGSENTEEAREQHEEELQEIYDKIGDDRAVENEVVHKANRSAGKIALFAICGIAFICLAVYMISGLRARNAYRDQHGALNVMEQYYQAGDYEAAADYYETHELSGPTYGKYEHTKDALHWLEYARKYMKDGDYFLQWIPEDADYQEWEESIVDNITFELDSAFFGLYKIQKMREDGYVYHEQAVVEYAENLVISDLKQYYALTDQEIVDGVALQAEPDMEREMYNALGQEIARYFWEQRTQETEQTKMQEGV